ncbi:mitochondrial substrate carrier family protein G-like [Sycon ciliatum]|uniref:mitochondrial substrate carrier family protein G-like n=1 Tax=Sycon ciliatum TaxID=27933 RepID=UPI0031F6743B
MTRTLRTVEFKDERSTVPKGSSAKALASFGKDVVAGTCGGIAICLVGHPFDTLKVRLQTQPTDHPLYSGLFDCFKKTLKWEGMGGLYRGVGSPLVGQMFFRATLFSTYYQTQRMFSSYPGQRLHQGEYMVCGAITGGAVSFVEGPVDLFKSKMQAQIIRERVYGEKPVYRNVFDCAGQIMRKHGIRGAYQALPAVAMRNVPAFATYFTTAEDIRNRYSRKLGLPVSQLPFYVTMVAGATGGILYWLLYYPFDVVKSAMQADNADITRRKYGSFHECIAVLYQEDGVRRFYRGFTPCMLRSIPANAVLFSVVEQVRTWLNKYFT